MLDMSIPFKNIIMRLERNTFHEPEPLPPGYSFRFFAPGDSVHWARIEASVLEFESVEAAERCFYTAYLPFARQLQERCLFVVDQTGLPIATANAWYADSDLGHQACLRSVSVCPEYQGRGIGKAIVSQALCVLNRLEPGCPVWLHTQTWSHVAIRLYHSLGFQLVRNGLLANTNNATGTTKMHKNDFADAIEVLRAVMPEDYINDLLTNAL